MELIVSIGSRLREVRELLGLSQTDFAMIAASAGVPGATRQSQAKYEKGQASPSAAYLAAIASEGADIQYILTGIRSSVVLAPEERFLLERWRGSSQERKDAALGALIGAAGNAEFVVKGDVGQNIKVDGDLKQIGLTFFGNTESKK